MTDYANLLQRPTVTLPEMASAIGISRSHAYGAAKRGDIPTIQIGRRLLVPTAKLRVLLGLDPQPPAGPARAHTVQEPALAA